MHADTCGVKSHGVYVFRGPDRRAGLVNLAAGDLLPSGLFDCVREPELHTQQARIEYWKLNKEIVVTNAAVWLGT